jgi:E3 ubiquitin-protein transferase RMND5
MNDVAESLIKEAKLQRDEISEDKEISELHKIFEEIHQHNLQSAIEWASKFSIELEAKNSSLEFKLHRLAFLQIIKGGLDAQNEAINYARINLSKFVSKYQKDFQVLMGCLLYLKVGLENSPYKFLMRDEMFIDAADVFLKVIFTRLIFNSIIDRILCRMLVTYQESTKIRR